MTGNLLRDALVALCDEGVPFVVCGGVACVLQGVPRATHDLDVRVALNDDALGRLVVVARRLGWVPRVPEPLEALLDAERRRVWVEEKRAVVYTLLAPSGAFSVDVFLVYPLSFEALAADADPIVIDGRTVRVSSKAHLITAKRAVVPPRKVDLRDIEDLLELMGGQDG